MKAKPIQVSDKLRSLMWFFVLLGLLGFFGAKELGYPGELLWGVYYSNLIFWMGLGFGGVAAAAIFQIVRAKWSPPVRRIAEAHVAFLPWAWCLFLFSWNGKEYLFPWGDGTPMPGRETWMQPWFVYLRFALLLGLLIFLMFRFVRLSLRSDLGVLRENNELRPTWSKWYHVGLSSHWKGAQNEVKPLQVKLSYSAPVLILFYVVITSLFSFEMIMAMDKMWYSNLFGAFIFMGNLFIAWAAMGFITVVLNDQNPDFERTVSAQQTWDLGKLMLGFSMIWAYFFFSQFLTQWYGNLPEETQWMILRTREYPWKALGWITFSMCFVIPFILLWSEDIKRAPGAFRVVCVIVLLGVFCERYMLVMPQLTPGRIPLGLGDLALLACVFLGFLGAYVLSIQAFLRRTPFLPVSHPLTSGSRDW